jgi:hypothetical protein
VVDSIKLEVKGLAEIKRKFEQLRKNAPQLASKVINASAGKMNDALLGSIFSTFDRPTPYTIRSFAVSYSTPSRLSAQVGLKEYQPKTGSGSWYRAGRPHYLLPQVRGGGRPLKRSEELLGGYYVPGAAAKLNAYGNVMNLQQILSALGNRIDPYQVTDLVQTARTRRGSRPGQRKRRLYWYGRVGKKKTLGVWAIGEGRGNERIRPVLIFPSDGDKVPSYRKRWDFYGIARTEFGRVSPGFVNKYFKQWAAQA